MKWIAVIASLLISTTALGQLPQAGLIIDAYGGVMATNSEGSRNLRKGSIVYQSDTIQTGTKTRVRIRLNDGAELVLGDKTQVEITQYDYKPGYRGGKGLITILDGFFKAASGLIAKLDQSAFSVKTTTATIGVKGTEFWLGYWNGGRWEATLLKGKGITVSTEAGSVELKKIGSGTSVTAKNEPPTEPSLWSSEKLSAAAKTIAW